MFDQFSFVRYEGENIVLLWKQWATAWSAAKITKTGLVKYIDHYIFEHDIERVIEPILNIKEIELQKMRIYHNDFVQHYRKLVAQHEKSI